MNREKKRKNQAGFTVLEVLLSITILGILLLSVLSYFTQAYSNTKRNEDKTIAINVARNALMFMEKQNYIKLEDFFDPVLNGASPESKTLQLKICSNGNGTEAYTYFKNSEPIPNTCNNISVNNIDYEIMIQSKKQINNREFFIPLIVEVTWATEAEQKSIKLEGDLKSEDIR